MLNFPFSSRFHVRTLISSPYVCPSSRITVTIVNSMSVIPAILKITDFKMHGCVDISIHDGIVKIETTLPSPYEITIMPILFSITAHW